MTIAEKSAYLLDRDELLLIRQSKLLVSDRDYLFFALQIDYPGKLNPTIDVEAFCDRWELSAGDLYKALGDLKNKGIIEAIANQLDLQIQPPSVSP